MPRGDHTEGRPYRGATIPRGDHAEGRPYRGVTMPRGDHAEGFTAASAANLAPIGSSRIDEFASKPAGQRAKRPLIAASSAARSKGFCNSLMHGMSSKSEALAP